MSRAMPIGHPERPAEGVERVISVPIPGHGDVEVLYDHQANRRDCRNTLALEQSNSAQRWAWCRAMDEVEARERLAAEVSAIHDTNGAPL